MNFMAGESNRTLKRKFFLHQNLRRYIDDIFMTWDKSEGEL